MWYFILIIVLASISLMMAFIIAFTTKDKTNTPTPKAVNEEESKRQFGEEGESIVARYLEGIESAYGGYLYNDFCFESTKGHSSEIDHLLITRGGVFIIETKHYGGAIRGGSNDEWWFRLRNGEQDKFKNPIIQNRKHVKHLKTMFGSIHPEMNSIVVFASGDISKIRSNCVFTILGAMSYIKGLTSRYKYSKKYVERVNSEIVRIMNKYSISKEEHIQNINNNYH